MTRTARKLIEELQALPEDEQEERAASYLDDLRQHSQEQEEQEDPYSALKIRRDAKLSGPADAREEEVAPYASFTYLQEANLDLPPDYSETYEEHLYGIKKNDDE